MGILQHTSNYTLSDNVYFETARKALPGLTQFTLFGENDQLTSSLSTVWEEGGLYEYIATPTVLKISSTSSDNTFPAGDGARTLLMAGLDENYDWQREIMTGTFDIILIKNTLEIPNIPWT